MYVYVNISSVDKNNECSYLIVVRGNGTRYAADKILIIIEIREVTSQFLLIVEKDIKI